MTESRMLCIGHARPAQPVIIWTANPDALDMAATWGQEDGISGAAPAGALHFAGEQLAAYNDGYSRGAEMRRRFWGK